MMHDMAYSKVLNTSGLLIVGLIALLHAIVASRIRHRGARESATAKSQSVALYVGLFVLWVALASPLSALAHHSVALHMLQHLLIMLLAAPLIVWARPSDVFVAVLASGSRVRQGRRTLIYPSATMARWIRKPATALFSFCGVIIIWHFPGPYHWAHAYLPLHWLMQASFFLAALLFWAVVLDPVGIRRLDFGRSILFVLSAALVTALPGALLTFAHRPILADPEDAFIPYNLSWLQDQQLAGLIMWIPMDLVLFGVSAALFVAWLSAAGRPTVRRVGAIQSAPSCNMD